MSSCRWCAYMCFGDAPWCSVKQKVLAESTIKTYKCKDFADCKIDAITLMDRKERKAKRKDGEQEVMKLD